MKLKHMFIVNAIIALAYALGELLVPATLLKIYGLGDNPGAEIILVARYFGWGLVAVGLITALVANAPQSQARQSIVKALFVAIGEDPFKLATLIGVETDPSGSIIVNSNQKTNVEGIYAAGDVTGGIRQVTTATGEGTTAAMNAYLFIKQGWYGEGLSK